MMGRALSPGRGLRRYDEAAALGDRLCAGFDGLPDDLAPGRVLTALKRAAPYNRVPIRLVSLIDLLFSWTKPQDWRAGAIPVVWPSNALLSEKLGIGVRQVQNLLNEAQRRGLIAFRDSPNGHRGGQRRDDGTLRWAYGIVLAPLGARYAEFLHTAQLGAEEDKAIIAARKRLAACRRKIRMLAQTAQDYELAQVDAESTLALAVMATNQLRNVRDRGLLEGSAEQMEQRERALEQEICALIANRAPRDQAERNACPDEKNFTHSTTTNQPQSAKADTSNGYARERSWQGSVQTNGAQAEIERDLDKHGITPDLIGEAAPELCTELIYGDRSWADVFTIAERLRDQHRIAPSAWREARRTMGERGAATSLIATIQKFQFGEVRRPGAYLRGMSEKAVRGELHLGRTMHGLKEANRKGATAKLRVNDSSRSIGEILLGYSRTR